MNLIKNSIKFLFTLYVNSNVNINPITKTTSINHYCFSIYFHTDKIVSNLRNMIKKSMLLLKRLLVAFVSLILIINTQMIEEIEHA